MCGYCDALNIEAPKQLNLFSDEEVERIIYDIYVGTINLRNLDVSSYLKVARKLTDGVFEGFGKNIDGMLMNTPDYKMLNALRENVYVFSGAKTYQETRQISSLLTTDGAISSFGDFKKKAVNIFDTYNKNYLTAEYNSAIAQSRSVSQWMDIEAESEVLPYLKYRTAGDGRVRPEHAELDGITKLVGDSFWNLYYPPNGWNCRCGVIQLDEGDVTDTKGFKGDSVPDIFRFNAGKERIVFSPKHPYFDIAPRDVEFAKLNFNLPLP
jgi:SPP1 gp7 family putative phage head morphogenesis protein